MTEAIIKNIKIAGICTVVGNITETIRDLEHLYDDKSKLDRLIKTVGLKKIQKVSENTTSLDLCLAASEKLISGLNIGTQELDALLFVTQTPDHFLPSNAAIAHRKLSLAKNCACFDINQGCAGYVYGLWIASSLMASGSFNKVLLLVGDTMSRAVNQRDKSSRPLFGDSGTATLLEKKKQASNSYFALNTDGSGNDAIIIPAGGFRHPKSDLTSIEKEDNDGNVRSMLNLYMNGPKVLNFAVSRVPHSVKRILKLSGLDENEIDFYIFHQANRYVIEKIVNKLKLNSEKVPRNTVGNYGNQGPASIPSTICDALSDEVQNYNKKILLCGFGTGFSWASAILDLNKIFCPLPTIYETNE